MDEVSELLKTWELPELIPRFTEHGITVQALSALTSDDIKDLIPLTGPRVLFSRCWRTWKSEFLCLTNHNDSFPGLDLSNIQFAEVLHSESNSDLFLVPPCKDNITSLSVCVAEKKVEGEKENMPSSANLQCADPTSRKETCCGLLESILQQSLESSSLLIYKGSTLEGDATRNLLASIIAKEILNEHKNSQIVGPIYFRWAKYITELFPGERASTYYIPACTTASGTVLQARGKLVHQVLNKRRRLQQLGALTPKLKRSREESPGTSSPRPLPEVLRNSNTLDEKENVEKDLDWLRNSCEPWNLVETKWKTTVKQRTLSLHSQENLQTIDNYFDSFPALKKPQGYMLLHTDFESLHEDHAENLFAYFPLC